MATEEPDTTIATRGHSTNLVGIPTGLLASASYNDFPVPLCISGTRESHRTLFERLNQLSDAVEAGRIFQDYMAIVFGLEHKPEENERRRFRANYLRLLKDWGFDANSPAGAVLKGWVESRFGLFPTFHKAPIRRFNSPAWIHYMEEKMSSRFNNNAINMQFDLLYEFCQWMLLRFYATGKKHLKLYRGTNDLREQQLIQQVDKRTAIVRLNNLISFSSQREIADEFGDTIIEAEVPVTKILFYNEMLPTYPLKGESEWLVIGGDYRVKMAYW
jgi:NAD+--dinitrogen-reductase ADP-D-ribosyltransferase